MRNIKKDETIAAIEKDEETMMAPIGITAVTAVQTKVTTTTDAVTHEIKNMTPSATAAHIDTIGTHDPVRNHHPATDKVDTNQNLRKKGRQRFYPGTRPIFLTALIGVATRII
jgi:hypothetical protein